MTLSAIAPALAAEENTLLERNTYNAATTTQNARHSGVAYGSAVNARHTRHSGAQAYGAADAFAFAPASVEAHSGQDFSIESQH